MHGIRREESPPSKTEDGAPAPLSDPFMAGWKLGDCFSLLFGRLRAVSRAFL